MSTTEALSQTSPKEIPAAPTNILVVGVGGQGVIMISKVLAILCQMQGHEVKQSEVHGMAKRGGSVFSHVRYGEKVWSPTITKGQVDILVALEWAEGLRWLDHLKPEGGVFIADTQHIVPPFACLNRKRGSLLGYSTETPAEIIAKTETGYALNAAGMAEELGNPRAANTILLGTLSSILDFPKQNWIDVIAQNVPVHSIEINKQAFEDGRNWVEKMRDDPAAHAEETARLSNKTTHFTLAVEDNFELRITPEWCKSCDICVKMCPERCLSLNADKIVELSKPDLCTGCRVCEWLCPDFAIDIIKPNHNQPQDQPQEMSA